MGLIMPEIIAVNIWSLLVVYISRLDRCKVPAIGKGRDWPRAQNLEAPRVPTTMTGPWRCERRSDMVLAACFTPVGFYQTDCQTAHSSQTRDRAGRVPDTPTQPPDT